MTHSENLSLSSQAPAADELSAATRSSLSASTFGRRAIFAYGLACYAIGVAGLNYMILVTLGMVPLTGGPLALDSTGAKITCNLLLIAVFGIQHAIMAREGFKRWWTRIIPKAAERATFTLIAGLLVAAIMFFWQPLDGSVWSVQSEAGRGVLLGLCAFGWAYMLLASFAIDHFELFGVKQVWRNLRGLDTEEPKLAQRLMYRFDRHPIMTGVLLGLWCTPDMTFTRFLLAAGFSAYMVVGVAMEERDLMRRHGQRYAAMAKRVWTIVPRLTSYR